MSAGDGKNFWPEPSCVEPTLKQGGQQVAVPEHRICLLVLGVHRSGTSALARVLSLLGAALPKNILGAGHGNEAGHWEPKLLVDLHDQMLAEAKNSWNDWRQLDLAALPQGRLEHYKSEIRRLISEEYGVSELIVLKEPRICRFVPLYREVLGNMGISVRPILSLRDPIEVADSLHHRDGIAQGTTQLVWLSQILPAERSTRDLPRAIVTYDELLSDWRLVANAVATGCRVKLRDSAHAAPEIEAFLKPQNRHFDSRKDEGRSFKPSLWVSEAYDYMKSQKSVDGSSSLKLDSLLHEFQRASDTLCGALCAEQSRALEAVASARSEILRVSSDLGNQLAAAQAEIGALRNEHVTPLANIDPERVAQKLDEVAAATCAITEESKHSNQTIATECPRPGIELNDLSARFSGGKDIAEQARDLCSPHPIQGQIPMSRLELLRAMVPHGGRGLEIRPGYQPAFPKCQGYNVKTADYIDQQGLRKKYATANVDISQIEEVDYITSADGLLAAIPERNCFDFVFASHVIEHIPDPIKFFNACAELLAVDGVLILAVPDCRYCFDVLQPLTTTGGLIDAHLRGDKSPSPGAVFDSVAYDALRGGKIGWGPDNGDAVRLNSTLGHAKRMLDYCQSASEYVDVHMWRYVPSSFELILNDLRSIGSINLGVSEPIESHGVEFFVRLSRVPINENFDRERAALAASREYRSVSV